MVAKVLLHRLRQRGAVVIKQARHALQAVAAQRQRHLDLRAAGAVLGIKQGAEGLQGGGGGSIHAAMIGRSLCVR